MKNLEELEEFLKTHAFDTYRPLDRDALLNTFLVLTLCKEISALRMSIENKDVSVKTESKSEVKEVVKGTPGRKKQENKEE